MAQALLVADLADWPLVVLTAGRGSNQNWFATEDQLVALSTKRLHRVVADANQASLIDREQDVAAVSRPSTMSSRPCGQGPR